MTQAGPLAWWLVLFVSAGFVFGVLRGFFGARKIQPKGFRWRVFRNEIFFATTNLAVSIVVLGGLTSLLSEGGFIVFDDSPADGWIVGFEYAVYFFAFDAYFYWLHRLMHIGPLYRWVHKVHHYSTSPNVLTTFSLNPIDSISNGAFLPIFLALFTVHESSMTWIGPTSVAMGIYVHSGYEFLPRWWNKSWATKWFITAMFHDQHHKYFLCNFGAYTTLWDRLCGTVRPSFEQDFAEVKARAARPAQTVGPVVGSPAAG